MMVLGAVLLGVGLFGAGCSSPSSSAAATAARSNGGTVAVVAGENEYGDVASQIGGPYVSVYSVDSNPNTDPIPMRRARRVAHKIAGAKLLIENGVGYDDFMTKLASASANRVARWSTCSSCWGSRQHPQPAPLVRPEDDAGRSPGPGLRSGGARAGPRGHLPRQRDQVRHVAEPWLNAIAGSKQVRREHGGDDRAGRRLPAHRHGHRQPDAVAVPGRHHERDRPHASGHRTGDGFFTKHQVKVFCYNQQVTDALTSSIRHTALKAGVPVVGSTRPCRPRVRLPVVDDGRGQRHRAGHHERHLHRAPVT